MSLRPKTLRCRIESPRYFDIGLQAVALRVQVQTGVYGVGHA